MIPRMRQDRHRRIRRIDSHQRNRRPTLLRDDLLQPRRQPRIDLREIPRHLQLAAVLRLAMHNPARVLILIAHREQRSAQRRICARPIALNQLRMTPLHIDCPRRTLPIRVTRRRPRNHRRLRPTRNRTPHKHRHRQHKRHQHGRLQHFPSVRPHPKPATGNLTTA